MDIKLIEIVLGMMLLTATVQAASVDFPGNTPGRPQAKVTDNGVKLENRVIGVSWKLDGGRLLLSEIENGINGAKYPQTNSAAFMIKDSKGAYITDWQVASPLKVYKPKVDEKSPSRGKHYSGKAVAAVFKSPGTGVAVHWSAEIRKDAGYVRTVVRLISADKSEKQLRRISLINNLKLPALEVSSPDKNYSGIPVYDSGAGIFMGMEVPFFRNRLNDGVCEMGFDCKLKVSSAISPEFSAVIAVYPEGQLRRTMLHYIDRERARSYRQFLHYNCWFDLERKVSEKGMIDRMDAIYNELGEKRGVYLDAYVVDDGYDDWNKGFWVFNEGKFPNGFAGLSQKLADIHSHLGVWLSPAGGYGPPSRARKKRAAEIGIKNFDLSTPIYYKWFLSKMTRFVEDDNMVYFKWDKLGNGVSNHFMALMDIARKLRKLNPMLFLNTTVGTWQSPFWLHNVDCTWRGGNDMGWMGEGDQRDQWLTYRDSISYKAMAKSKFIYPLNALMNHGIVFANGHQFANKALMGSHDMRNDVRIYFAGGYALQELYLTPSILEDEQWDAIAAGAKWAKKNADILVDSHFVGGDPNQLEVYGFAAWQNNRGTLALRNPKSTLQKISFDIGSFFELPKGGRTAYQLKASYADQRIKTLKADAGKQVEIELQPFEVLVFDAK